MTPALLGLLVYLVLMVLVGAWAAGRVKDETDYLVAGRSLGPWLVGASVFATWFGVESVIGAAGVVYGEGVGAATSEPFGYAVALVFGGLVFAAPLWRLGLTTYADLFRSRYGPGVERLVVALYVPSSVLWAAAQIRGFGAVLGLAGGFGGSASVLLAAALTLLYTLLGGLLADAVTDLVQAVAILVGLGLLAIAVTGELGGVEATLAALSDAHPSAGAPGLLAVAEAWAIPVTGSVLSAEILQRMIAARSPPVARWGTVGGASLYLLVGLVPLALGLLGPRLLPGLEDPEQLVPALAERHLGALGFAVFAGALASMALSTVDSALLVGGGLVAHNLLGPLLARRGDRARLLGARGAVLACGLAASALALGAESVYALVETATALGGSGAFVVGVMALFSRFGGPWSAATALILGVGVWAWGSLAAGWEAPYLASLLAASLGYGAVGLVERAGEGGAGEPAPR